MTIWLIDANSYAKSISSDLRNLKQEYFIIKNYVREKTLGKHIMPKTKTYSLGLLRIATILQYNGHHVRYMHFQDIEQTIAIDNWPDIIAFSAVCPMIPVCHEFVEKYKKLHPATQFVLGGSHLNVAEQLTKNKFPLFDRYAVGYDVDGAEKVVQQTLCAPTGPYVNFSLLPNKLSDYAINTCSTIGCPYNCKYCQDRLIPHCQISKDGFLPYFIEHLPERTCVHFFDSVLGGSKKGLINVCKEITKCNHNFLLSCDIRAELIDEYTIEALSQAGFVEIRLGIETADEAVLTKNDRYLTLDTLLRKLEMCRNSSDLYIALYSATGLPGTTLRSLELSKNRFSELLQTRSVDEIKTCLFVPYPLDFERYATNEIIINSDDWRNYDRQSMPVFELPNLSSAQLWSEHLDIARRINQAWLSGWGIESINTLPDVKYGEYNIENYAI